MSIYITKESEFEYNFNYKQIINEVINEALDYIKCPYETEVNILLTDNDKIKVMNNEFRNINKATDVLSFPMLEYKLAGNFEFLDQASDEFFNLDTGELILGDIVISTEQVTKQAKMYGHSEKREFSFLIAHSMLHLFGYDHLDDLERVCMEKMQNEILDKLNIKR